MKIRLLCLCVVLCASVLPLGAMDVGLLLDQSGTWSVMGDDGNPGYSGTLVPRVSLPLGNGRSLFLSAGLMVQYASGSDVVIVPEILRTELTLRLDPASRLSIGRVNYSDPLGFVLQGLFDGVAFSRNVGGAFFSAGLWYTGLLYKKSACITITPDDNESFHEAFEFDRFLDSYFASRRVVSALNYEHPSLGGMVRFKASLLGQFDLNDRDDKYHSQYLVGKISVPVRNLFVFDAGGSFELVEFGDEVKPAFAGELGFAWMPPTSFQDRFFLRARFSSGVSEDGAVTAFTPISSETQGTIFKGKLSGISALKAEYTARLHQSFSFTLEGSYFMRTDLGTWQGWPVGAEGYFPGAEFYGRLFWSPVSDLRLVLGGGVFLPSLGDIDPAQPPAWQVELNMVLSLY